MGSATLCPTFPPKAPLSTQLIALPVTSPSRFTLPRMPGLPWGLGTRQGGGLCHAHLGCRLADPATPFFPHLVEPAHLGCLPCSPLRGPLCSWTVILGPDSSAVRALSPSEMSPGAISAWAAFTRPQFSPTSPQVAGFTALPVAPQATKLFPLTLFTPPSFYPPGTPRKTASPAPHPEPNARRGLSLFLTGAPVP